MINNMNHWSPPPLLWEKDTTLPLEAIGGPVRALDEAGVEMKAPSTWAMVEVNGAMVEVNSAKMETNVICLFP